MSKEDKKLGAKLELSNISLVKSKFSKKKVISPLVNEAKKELVHAVNFKVDKYYRDMFYQYSNMYFASGTTETFNRTTYFKVLKNAFFENNINVDNVNPISDKDFDYYTRIGRRRRADSISPLEVGGNKSSIFLHLSMTVKKDIYSNMQQYYKEKEELRNSDLYSIPYFFRELINWMVKGNNFKKYILKNE